MSERKIYISCQEVGVGSDFITRVKKELDIAIECLREREEKTIISISNIPSAQFCDLFNIEAEEYNGWQCDWWSTLSYSGEDIHVFGCAWEASVELSIEL